MAVQTPTRFAKKNASFRKCKVREKPTPTRRSILHRRREASSLDTIRRDHRANSRRKALPCGESVLSPAFCLSRCLSRHSRPKVIPMASASSLRVTTSRVMSSRPARHNTISSAANMSPVAPAGQIEPAQAVAERRKTYLARQCPACLSSARPEAASPTARSRFRELCKELKFTTMTGKK